jgi:D-2-hydroxyacid dehydrogenase (NADP+)
VLVTSGRGVQAAPVSAAALSLMLALSRELPRMVANQPARRWERWASQLLDGHTLGILGVGQIGEVLALKARALGMRVVGVSSGTRPVEGFDRMYARESLREAVGEMDYLVVLTPYSADTHHLVDASVLGAMKPGAFLINVSRGGVVNEADLAHALRANRIRGAALDVFEREPLPADSELWSLPNLIVSPHLGGLNSSYPESVLPLVIDNIRLYKAGKLKELRNIVAR